MVLSLLSNFNLLISLLLPIAFSPVAYLIAKKKAKAAGIFSFLVLIISCFLIASEINAKEVYPWIPAFDLNFGLILDGLSYPIALVIVLVSALSALASVSYMEEKENLGGYYLCLMLFAAGMLGSVLASSLLQFYLFFELMVIPSYFLIAYWGHKNAQEIGFKYFIWTRVAGLFLLVASLLTYINTGTFLISRITKVAPWISFLFLVAFFIKMAIFPLHNWLPDAHSEAPAPISAMLSGAMIKVGAYGIIRIVLRSLGFQFGSYLNIFFALALITMIYGAMLALVQDDLKRLLAFSSISHMGYVFFGVLGTKLGHLGSIFHMFNHAMAKGLLFLGSGAIIYATGTRDMKKLGGLIKKMPLTAFAMIVGALSLAGTPPLSGFLSEFFIFGGVLEANQLIYTALGLVTTVLTLGYYLVMIKKVFFGKEMEEKVERVPLYLSTPLLVLSLMTIVFGIWPQPVLGIINSFLG